MVRTATAPKEKPRFASPAAAIGALRSSIETEVTSLRDQIAERQEALRQVTEGNATKAEYLQRVGAWIDDQAVQFQKSAEYSIAALRLPKPRPNDVQFGKLAVHGAGSLSPEVVAVADGSGLFAWLLGDQLKARLAEVIQASPYPEGPPLAAREQLRRDLQGELDALELQEESLVVESESIGLAMARRPDARPEIILSLELQNHVAE